jgi:hypothetical protein
MIIKYDNGDGTFHYSGSLFGYTFGKNFTTDEDFTAWMKTKLQEEFTGFGLGQTMKDLLGINDLEDRVTALENP